MNRASQIRVSFLMAFKDSKIYQLCISCGLRMTATMLAVQSSRLFNELNYHERHDKQTRED